MLLVFRESSLREADDEEQDDSSVKKKIKKRKVLELDREQDAEYWVLKRQKMKARKHEEATKTKRTVFVGNLPVTCTKKVLLQNIIGLGLKKNPEASAILLNNRN